MHYLLEITPENNSQINSFNFLTLLGTLQELKKRIQSIRNLFQKLPADSFSFHHKNQSFIVWRVLGNQRFHIGTITVSENGIINDENNILIGSSL